MSRVTAGFQSRMRIVEPWQMFSDDQIEEFQQGLVAWKRAAVLGDLVQAHVHRINGVGGVDDALDIRRVIKNGVMRGRSKAIGMILYGIVLWHPFRQILFYLIAIQGLWLSKPGQYGGEPFHLYRPRSGDA